MTLCLVFSNDRLTCFRWPSPQRGWEERREPWNFSSRRDLTAPLLVRLLSLHSYIYNYTSLRMIFKPLFLHKFLQSLHSYIYNYTSLRMIFKPLFLHKFLQNASGKNCNFSVHIIFLRQKIRIKDSCFRTLGLISSFVFRRLSLYTFCSGCDGIQGLGLSGRALELNLLPVPCVCFY